LLDAIGTPHFNEVLEQVRSTSAGLALVNAPLMAAIQQKHASAMQREPLSCLQTIELCLSDCTDMPQREIQVCARMLYGYTSAGIAGDLNICEATIRTYRKRAYQRLSIGCERELITWYLRTWADWNTPGRSMGAQPQEAGASGVVHPKGDLRTSTGRPPYRYGAAATA
jgi:DNA-binding NarL/FixJ family response regulator